MDHDIKSFDLKPKWSYSAAGHQLFVLMVGLVMQVIGYCTPAWGVAKNLTPEKRLGVWEECKCQIDTTPDETWYRAFQALITISGLFLMLGLLLGFIYIFCKGFSKSWLIGITLLVLLVSVVCGVIGYALFAADLTEGLTVSWSYAIHLVGTVFVFFATLSIAYHWYRISFI